MRAMKTRWRVTMMAALGAAVILTVAGPAHADQAAGGGVSPDPGNGSIDSEVIVDVGSPGSGQAGVKVCVYTLAGIPEGFPVHDEDGRLIPTDGTGFWYEKVCDGVFEGVFYISRRDPRLLFDYARRRLTLPLPTPGLSPAGDQIVNLPSWLWIADGWTERTSRVAIEGIAVSVAATPMSVQWSMGDGAVVVCEGPGVAFDASRPAAAQQPTCTHIYRRSSARIPGLAYTAAVTVKWSATWSVEGFAGGGVLPDIERTTTFAVRVGEVQSVNIPAS